MDELDIVLFKAVSDFVYAVSTYRPFLATTKFTPPNGLYLTLNIISIKKVSQYATLYNDVQTGEDKRSLYSQYLVEIDLRAYGTRAISIVQGIVDKLKDKSSRQILSAKGVGYSDVSDVNNISIAINNQKIEERASSVLSLYFVQGGDERLSSNWIDTATIDPTYNP